MNRYKLIRMQLETAGTPADAGAAGTAPATEPAGNGPAQEPVGKPAPATPPATQANEPKNNPAGTAPATEPAGNDKHSLLGGAQTAGTQPATGSAGTNPDGGTQTGDGQNATQDPYKDLTLPDGAAVDQTQMAKYKDLAKNLNLKPEAAQAILDFEAERLSAGAAAAAAAWQEQVKQEHGDKLPLVLATCAKAIDQFGGDELRTLLDQTGLGNHPLLVKAFYKAGTLIKEDKSVSSNGTATGDLTFTEALYGRSK
nr:MAG TPA: putative protease [Caudoviricetes sp.]